MSTTWKKGDIAICIKTGNLTNKPGNNPLLRLNAEYIIQNVKICECGDIDLDIGLSSNDPRGILCQCGALTSPKTGIWWCSSARFVKKRTKSEINAELNEAVQTENFELAHTLQEELNNISL